MNYARMRRARSVSLAIGLAALATLAGCQVRTTEETAPRPEARSATAAATDTGAEARYLSGGEGAFALAQYKGRVTLIDVFATWSEPCREGVPAFNRLHEEAASKGLAIVGLAVDRGAGDDVAAAVRDLGAIYPVAGATPATLRELGPIRAVPTRLLLGRDGSIRHRYPGAVPLEQIRADALALLGEG